MQINRLVRPAVPVLHVIMNVPSVQVVQSVTIDLFKEENVPFVQAHLVMSAPSARSAPSVSARPPLHPELRAQPGHHHDARDQRRVIVSPAHKKATDSHVRRRHQEARAPRRAIGSHVRRHRNAPPLLPSPRRMDVFA